MEASGFTPGDLVSPVTFIIRSLEGLITRRVANRRSRFDKVYQDLFDRFLEVHANYMLIFTTLRSDLMDVDRRSKNGEIIDVTEGIQQVHDYFENVRLRYDGERTHLRSLADRLIRVTRNKSESRLIWAILCYFLEYDAPHKDRWEIESGVSLLINNGYNGVFNSPSSFLLNKLATETDLLTLIGLVTNELSKRSEYLSDVCNAFAALKVPTYGK